MTGQFPNLPFPSLKAWGWSKGAYKGGEWHSLVPVLGQFESSSSPPQKLFGEMHKDKWCSNCCSQWMHFFHSKTLKSLQSFFQMWRGLRISSGAWLCPPFQAYLGKNGPVQARHVCLLWWISRFGLGICQLDAFPQSHSSFLKEKSQQGNETPELLIQSRGWVGALWNPHYQII